MSTQQQELKLLRQKISQLTNKTITSLAHLGYDQYLTIEILTNQPLQVLEQALHSLLQIIPYADQLPVSNNSSLPNVSHNNNNPVYLSNPQRQIQISENQQISNDPTSVLRTQLMQNQEHILESIEHFVLISEALSDLSHTIYESDQNYSLPLYKKFRKLYEQINLTSNILHQFQPQCYSSESFIERKQQLINRQIGFLEKILEHSQSVSEMQKYKQRHRKHPSETESQFEMGVNNNTNGDFAELQREIQYLQESIRQNDEQYSTAIQKYNGTLFDLQDQIAYYERELQKTGYERINVEEMKQMIQRMQQEKYRDEIVIDNMTKKIRTYEKSLGINTYRENEASRFRLGSTTTFNKEDWKNGQRQRFTQVSGLKYSRSATRLGNPRKPPANYTSINGNLYQ